MRRHWRGGVAAAVTLSSQVRGLRLMVGAAGKGEPSKVRGEDAFCADARISFVGVADGVGGSKSEKVDPGEFSRRLLAWCHRHAATETAASATQKARESCAVDEVAKKGGSSTLLVAKLANETLEVCNFGDSAALLLRPSVQSFGSFKLVARPVLRTSAQTYGFNAPYQASSQDAFDDAWMTMTMGYAQEPDALSARAKVGDVCVLGTDGLWDNVSDELVTRIVTSQIPLIWAAAARQNCLWEPEKPREEVLKRLAAMDASSSRAPVAEVLEDLAHILVDCACQIYSDPTTKVTPFSMEANKAGYAYKGGKPDDVSVVVGLVVPDDAELPPQSLLHNFDDCGLSPS